MTIIRRLFWSLPVWAALAALLVGCAEDARDVQLQKVAKDWSATIRASQVLPVYPLTEDLYPGDVFLVTKPIEDQVALYQRNGYLPLDQHVGRLTNLNFNEYYWNYYGTGNATDIAPVGTASLGAGYWNQLDLAGEVSEWNLDWYAAYAACTDCANTAPAAVGRVFRGGYFDYDATILLPPDRDENSPAFRDYGVGFRCARTP